VTDTASASFEVLGVEPVRGAGRLVGLAIVRVELEGVELVLQGVQVLRTPAGLTVQAPTFRHPKHGCSVPSVILPPELRDAIGAEVLASMGEGHAG